MTRMLLFCSAFMRVLAYIEATPPGNVILFAVTVANKAHAISEVKVPLLPSPLGLFSQHAGNLFPTYRENVPNRLGLCYQ